MAKVKINVRRGVKEYFNDQGDLHREDGPARIFLNGTKSWYRNNSRYEVKYGHGRYYKIDDYGNQFMTDPNGFISMFDAKRHSRWPVLE